ncbi:MAG: DUF460 domain-containing protein [Nanopusillaceae archaeon]
MEAYIAGIDPGTNFALVVIDENYNIVKKLSGKNIEEKEIIKFLKELNNVVLIATDKNKIPKKVMEISSKLNIGIYYPKEDIDIITKKEYYENPNLKNILENNHEFDAYISASEALKNLKEIFNKAKKIAKDQNEYINILKITLKNRNIEPFAAKNILEKDNYRREEIKRKRKKKINKKKLVERIEIIVRNKIEQEEKKKIEELNKKYIELLENYNKLSIELFNRLKENDIIVPKISFLYLNNLNGKRIFLDEKNEEYIKRYISSKTIFFVKREDLEFIKNYSSNIYIVTDFLDLKNFVIVKSFEKYENIVKKMDEKELLEKLKRIVKENIGEKYRRDTL